MMFSRRSLATILAFSGLSVLTATASIAVEDDAAIDQAIEALRQAMLAKDKAQFEVLCADDLTYGHSSGKIENKMEFIASAEPEVALERAGFRADEHQMSGDIGIVRAVLTGVYEVGAKVIPIKDSVLMVLRRQGGQWKLIERQAYKT